MKVVCVTSQNGEEKGPAISGDLLQAKRKAYKELQDAVTE